MSICRFEFLQLKISKIIKKIQDKLSVQACPVLYIIIIYNYLKL